MAALDGRGLDLVAEFAAELGLHEPVGPWHVQRDGLIELGHWAVLLSTSLGKMGLDIALLAQSEIAEVSEAGGRDRGGSSTMPPKVNPRSEEHTSELQSLMRIPYAVFCLKKKNNN